MRLIFRADTRAPETLFASGFQPRQDGGVKITDGAQMSGGVSTSKDLGVSIRYAALYDGWVYVAVLDGGTDVIGYLAKKGLMGAMRNAFSQMEIAAPNVPGNQIIAAIKCRQSGQIAEMFGKMVINASCTADRPDQDLGMAYLNSSVTVSKDYH